MATQSGPFEDLSPSENGVSSIAMLVHQRVTGNFVEKVWPIWVGTSF